VATKKQKRARGLAKRAAFEKEERERGLHFLKLEQQRRAEEHRRAEEAKHDIKVKKAKRLAKEHEASKGEDPEAMRQKAKGSYKSKGN